MYEIIKTVIESSRFELSDILKKIDTIWMQGDITEEQRSELATIARKNADPTQSIDIRQKLEELDKRVTALENKEPSEEYPEYVAGKWYYKDDKITYKSVKYICTALDGQVCTWNPDEYPEYWMKI